MKVKITQITDEHLLNRIRFFEKKLKEAPAPSIYMGNSDYAEDAVEQENRYNESITEVIKSHITYMKREAKKRGLVNI